jgi:hypothetical protein
MLVAHRTAPNLIYSHRPFRELPEIIVTAKELHAKIIWTQSGVSAAGVDDPKGCWVPAEEQRLARNLVEAPGLNYVTEPYIGDVARESENRVSLLDQAGRALVGRARL